MEWITRYLAMGLLVGTIVSAAHWSDAPHEEIQGAGVAGAVGLALVISVFWPLLLAWVAFCGLFGEWE